MGENILADFSIKVTSDISQAMAGLNALGGALGSLSGLGSALTRIGTALTLGVTPPIMAVAAAAVWSENTLQGFYKTLEAGSVGGKLSFDQLKSSFDQLYSSFPQGGNEIANTLLNVSNVMGSTFGQNQKEIQDFATSFLQLSGMTGENADKMSKTVTQAFAQWHVPAQDAQSDLQYLWQASEQARTSITTLADQTGQYGQILNGAGFTMKDSIALLGEMDKNGMDVSKTVTGIGYGMATLSQGGKAVAPVLADISKEEGGISTSSMTAAQMFDGLSKGIQDGSITMGDATAIFGKRYATNIYEAIKNGHLSFEQFETDAGNFKTSISDAWGKVETFGQKLETLKHDLEEALAPLGITIIDTLEGFMPVIQTILGFVNQLFSAFNKLPAPIKDAIIIIAGIAAAIGPVLMIVGALISAFSAVATAVGAVIGFVIGLPAAILGASIAAEAFLGALLPVLPIIIAIAAAIAIVVGAVLLVVAAFVTWYMTSQTLRDLLGGAITFITTELGKLADAAGKVFADLQAGNISKAFDDARTALQGFLSDLGAIDWSTVWAKLVQSLRESINVVGTVIGGLRDQIAAWASKQDWASIGKQIGDYIGQGIVAFFQGAVDILQAIFDALSGRGGQANNGKSAGTEIAKNLGTGIQDYFKSGQLQIDLGNAITISETAMGGVVAGLQAQLDRIHINWGNIASDLGTIFAAVALLFGADLTNAMLDALSKLPVIGDAFKFVPRVDTGPLVQNVKDAVANADPKAWVTIDPSSIQKMQADIGAAAKITSFTMVSLQNAGELHGSVASAVIGPHPTHASLVNGSDILISVAKSIVGPHPTNGTLANGLAINGATAQAIVGPHPTNANLANSSTVNSQTASAIIGPHPANATVTNVNTAMLQNLAATAHADVNSFTNLLGTITLPATAEITAVSGTLSAAQKILAEGGVVQAAGGAVVEAAGGYGVLHGPQLVMAAEAGLDEAFVPLKNQKIPVQLSGGVGGGPHVYVTGNHILNDRDAARLGDTILNALKHKRGAIR